MVQWPNGVTIDFFADRLYWVDAKSDYIASADLDGKNIKKILEGTVSIVLFCFFPCVQFVKICVSFESVRIKHFTRSPWPYSKTSCTGMIGMLRVYSWQTRTAVQVSLLLLVGFLESWI